jgi:hypothetical protein
MLGSAVLDTTIGMMLIFFIISTMCSSAYGLAGRIFQIRGRLLRHGLLYMFEKTVLDEFMQHPLIQDISLSRKPPVIATVPKPDEDTYRKETDAKTEAMVRRNKFPPYIDPRTFTKTFLDMLIQQGQQIFLQNQQPQAIDEMLNQLTKAGIQQLDEATRALVRAELNKALSRHEDDVLNYVNSLLDNFDPALVSSGLRQQIVADARALFADKNDLLNLVNLGIDQLKLPQRSKAFLHRHIETIQREKVVADLTQTAVERYTRFTQSVEDWFNNVMASISNVFRLYTQLGLGAIAVVVTLYFNLNTLTMADTLWTSPAVREAVVASAELRVQQEMNQSTTDNTSPATPIDIFTQEIQSLNLPVGWTEKELKATGFGFLSGIVPMVEDPNRSVPGTSTNFFGWALTIGAAMFGAPFWYDLLKKLLNIRSGEKST